MRGSRGRAASCTRPWDGLHRRGHPRGRVPDLRRGRLPVEDAHPGHGSRTRASDAGQGWVGKWWRAVSGLRQTTGLARLASGAAAGTSEGAAVQADQRIIELLNRVLTFELTAVNQYFLNGRMCSNWGYERLAERHRAISLEEMHDGIALCLEVGDQGTREFLAGMLAEEERHCDYWETQLAAVDAVGEANYLAQQLRA